MFLTKHTFLWKFINAIISIIYISVLKDFSEMNFKNGIYMGVALFLLLPRVIFVETGIIATTLNYFWPITLGLWGVLILFKSGQHLFVYIFGILALIFGCNQEQFACVIFLFVCINFLILLKNGEIWQFKKKYILPGIILLLSIFNFLLCSGNKVRFYKEIRTWFPDYLNLSFLRKLELGFSTTGKFLFLGPSFLLFTFYFLLVA